MRSEFEKLTPEQQDICLARGYNPLYRDYATTDEAMAQVRSVALDPDAKQIDITGAIRAYVNTVIVAVRRAVSS